MGMPLTKYTTLYALGYGEPYYMAAAARHVLGRFKLCGLILHDPDRHSAFHHKLSSLFERLDYLTGNDFLFLALTDPPKTWRGWSSRDYMTEKFLSPNVGYSTSDKGITALTLANAIGIEYADLPAIILTNDFQLSNFKVVQTCIEYLEKQMFEIGFFCSQLDGPIVRVDDERFLALCQSINYCGNTFDVSNSQSLAKLLSDTLAFIVATDRSERMSNAEDHVRRILDEGGFRRYDQITPLRREQLCLTLLGCLHSYLSDKQPRPELGDDGLDPDCEETSQILFRTFMGVKDEFYRLGVRTQTDYSPLVISLSKIFEIELNLSIVQWMRNKLGISMPEYFNRYKANGSEYFIQPTISLVSNPRPIDLNKSQGNKWLPPGMGESWLALSTLLEAGETLPIVNDTDKLLLRWDSLRRSRNKAAHADAVYREEYIRTLNVFNELRFSGQIDELIRLKMQWKPNLNA